MKLRPILSIIIVVTAICGLHVMTANAVSYISSQQLAPAPSNGNCLLTNGVTNTWSNGCSGGGSSTISINGVSSTVFYLNSSTYLGITASGTAFTFTNLGVTSTAGNWAGTWQGVNSGTFYLASNPAGYITSTGSSATGTAFYFPFWNASGTALSPTSSITVSSTSGNVGIDTTNTSQNLTVSGNAQITASDGSKEYRFRTTGLAMDWEGSNAPLDFSVWSGNNFSGTQEDYFSAQGSSHAIYNAGNWYWQDGNDVFGHGNNPVFTILGDPNGGVVVGASTSSAMLGVVSNQTTTASFVRSGTATTTVIQGSASSTACSTFYTPSGTAIYSTYLATGQILTSTSSCQ